MLTDSRDISVLIPCYNAAPYIADALDSVLAQTVGPLEIIVVDDGSTDGSADVLDRYRARGVTVIRQDNQGQCVAVNRALAASSGKLVKFFDADDLLAPDMIERQVARLGDRRDAVAMGEWGRFYGNDPTTARFEPLAMYHDAAPAEWLSDAWLDARPMMQCALWLVPRAVLDRAGGWDEDLSLINDFEYFARVLLHADEILYTPGARLFYRSGVGNSLSGQRSAAAVLSAFNSLMRGTAHLLAVTDSRKARRACANMLRDFDYSYYPAHPHLRAAARQRAAELGGSDLAPDGPPNFHRLRGIVGWRMARRIQLLATRLRVGTNLRQDKAQ